MRHLGSMETNDGGCNIHVQQNLNSVASLETTELATAFWLTEITQLKSNWETKNQHFMMHRNNRSWFFLVFNDTAALSFNFKV